MTGRRRAGQRHNRRQRARRRASPLRVLLAVLALAGLTLGAVTLHRISASAGGCDHPLTLRVSADPMVSAPLAATAADYDRSRTTVDGRCVAVQVTATPSATALATFSRPATAKPATVRQTATETPDVWVPESTDWLNLAGANPTAAAIIPRISPAIASSPLVVAMPGPMVSALGAQADAMSWAALGQDRYANHFWAGHEHPEWGEFRFGFALPGTSTASRQALVAMAAADAKVDPSKFTITSFTDDRGVQLSLLGAERSAAAVAATPADLASALRAHDAPGQTPYLSAAPMLEAQLIAYNRGQGSSGPARTPLTALYPRDGLDLMPVPYAVTAPASGDPERARAAASFLARLSTADGQAALRAAGLRSPAGAGTVSPASGIPALLPAHRVPTLSGDVLAAAVGFFDRIHQRGSTLAVIDVSGSMATKVTGVLPPATRLQLATNAATTGLALFAPDDQVGLWQFSTDLADGRDYQQLSPVAALDSPSRLGLGSHLGDLRQLAAGMRPRNDTALYETTLAAFEAKNAAWVPGRLNQVVVLTDGANDDPGHPGGLSLTGLLDALKAQFNRARPTRIITIAYGEDADPGPLERISAATGARSYISRNPADILNVFIDAVTDGG